MHLHADGTLSLSPSDVTAFLACEHLTTLSLAHARGELERPEVDERAGGADLPQGRSSTSAPTSSTSAPTGKTVARDRSTRAATTRAPPARPPTRSATAGRRRLPGRLRARAAGAASPTSSLAPAGRRCYEALDTKLARRAKPAYILQLCFYNEQLARIQGREPEQIHVLLGSGEQASRSGPQEFAAYYRRVRARLERFVADPPPTEPCPVDHCGICDFKPLCDACWDAVDHLSRVAGIRRDADREARGRRDHDARRSSAARRPSPCRPGSAPDTWAKIREQAELQLHRARDRRATRYRLLPAAAGSRLRAPARALAGRPLLRLRGQPVLGRERRRSSTSGGSSTSSGNFTPLHAHDHDDRAAGVRDSSSTSSTSGSRATPTCTSTTTRRTRSPRSSG